MQHNPNAALPSFRLTFCESSSYCVLASFSRLNPTGLLFLGKPLDSASKLTPREERIFCHQRPDAGHRVIICKVNPLGDELRNPSIIELAEVDMSTGIRVA